MSTDKNTTNNDTEKAELQEGPQGVDKAPGEDPAKGNMPFSEQSQKGKKVDGDPTQQSDQPAKE